ncbi:hypothetical protein HYALB_00002794 [Hymenoscyphus albidus]|uniref:Uncharacterized protein n=1 Tax=Hymenoscyphus albidus TaxID=595503 RepID=A0A9N9LJ90_9HELO|nr:hypothetical protein HYALB_00002794 [Hymenoscyphus albidus]
MAVESGNGMGWTRALPKGESDGSGRVSDLSAVHDARWSWCNPRPEGDGRKRRLTDRQISELDGVSRRNAVEASEQCRRADSGWNCEDSFVNAGTKRKPLADADDNDHPSRP